MVLVELADVFLDLAQEHPEIKIVAINDFADAKTLSHLLKYDSIHGVLTNTFHSDDEHIIVNDNKIPLFNRIIIQKY